MRLIIKPEGKLALERWKYSKKKKRGKYVQKDVTEKAPLYLFYPPCEIDDGVTLGDIIQLVERHIDFWGVAVNRWIEEFVAESKLPTEQDTECKHLELYSVYELEDGTLESLPFPSIHGIGRGTVPIGISYSQVNTLVHLPVKIAGAYIYDDSIEDPFKREVLRGDRLVCSLGQIVQAIFWELSWNGRPEQRDKRFEKLESIMEKIVSD